MSSKETHIRPTASIPKPVLIWCTSRGLINEMKLFVYLKYSHKQELTSSGLTKPVVASKLAEKLNMCRQTVSSCLLKLEDLGFINKGGKKNPNCFYTRSWNLLIKFCYDRMEEGEKEASKKNRKKTIKIGLEEIYTKSKKDLGTYFRSAFIVENLQRQNHAIETKARKARNSKSRIKGGENQSFRLGGGKIGDWFSKTPRTGRRYRKAAEKAGFIKCEHHYEVVCGNKAVYDHLKATGEFSNLFERNGQYVSRKGCTITIKNNPFDYGRK